MEKFTYLCVQLDGQASRTVECFTDPNHERSISVLKFKETVYHYCSYGSSVRSTYLRLPTMLSVSATYMLFVIESLMQGLKSLGNGKDTFGDLLIPRKLPSAVRWKLTCDYASDEWNIDELHSSIEKEITILESGLEQQNDHSWSTVTTASLYTSMYKG